MLTPSNVRKPARAFDVSRMLPRPVYIGNPLSLMLKRTPAGE